MTFPKSEVLPTRRLEVRSTTGDHPGKTRIPVIGSPERGRDSADQSRELLVLRIRTLIDEPGAEDGDRTGQLAILFRLQCASVDQVIREHVGVHSPGQAPFRVVDIVGSYCSPDDADNLAFPQSILRDSSHHRRNQLHRLPHLLAPAGSIAALPAIRCHVLDLLDIHLAEVATGLVEAPEQGCGLGVEVLRPPLRTLHNPFGDGFRSGFGAADAATVEHPLHTGRAFIRGQGAKDVHIGDLHAGGPVVDESFPGISQSGTDENDGQSMPPFMQCPDTVRVPLPDGPDLVDHDAERPVPFPCRPRPRKVGRSCFRCRSGFPGSRRQTRPSGQCSQDGAAFGCPRPMELLRSGRIDEIGDFPDHAMQARQPFHSRVRIQGRFLLPGPASRRSEEIELFKSPRSPLPSPLPPDQDRIMSEASNHADRPRLHNAMWPGLVGKGTNEGQEPPISLDRMLDLTAQAEVDGQKFEGIDYFLFHPHTDPEADDDAIRAIADSIARRNLSVGSLVAPVWQGTVGDSAMGDEEARRRFLEAVRVGCRIAGIFNRHGIRKYGVIRIDSAEFGIDHWRKDPAANTRRIAATFREAARIAADHGERLAAEGEICWAGMHSWKDMIDLLEEVGMPETVGFQADLAHTYLYLLGYNAPEHALLSPGHSREEFWAAYEDMTDKLRPWTIDFHVAQNDGEVKGAGDHDKTGKHCPADDPAGKLDIVRCSGYWLGDAPRRGIRHICWDGCMFPNALLETPATWNTILSKMIEVRRAHGWTEA